MSELPDLLREQINNLGDKIAKKYRIAPAEAERQIRQFWLQRQDLQQLAAQSANLKALTRTRVYKEAERDVTRRLYYELRRYQSQDAQVLSIQNLLQSTLVEEKEAARLTLVQNHVSTAERLPHLDVFWQQIQQVCGAPRSIIDVGCGLLPLVFPWDQSAIEHYLALDRSQESIDAIQAYQRAFGRQQLSAQLWAIQDGWHSALSNMNIDLFDVAFMFKLIPVVARQEVASLAVLAQVPARRLVVTGCKTAMVKHQDISRREKGILHDFVHNFNFQVEHTFETPDEVGLVLVRG